MAVRGVHDGINLEDCNVTLPREYPRSSSVLDPPTDRRDQPQRYTIQEGRLGGVLGRFYGLEYTRLIRFPECFDSSKFKGHFLFGLGHLSVGLEES